MPHRSRKESCTGFYHVFVRGINHEMIFNQAREKGYFLKILKKHLKEYDVEIYAYCIMSTHAHFIIKSQDIYEMSMFMSKILAEYASYYNYKKNRNGHVFANRFRSECIEDMYYFWTCLKYIHMNPVKAHMESTAWEYKYSSMNDYRREKAIILHKNAIDKYKDRFQEWAEFIEFHHGKNVEVFLGTDKEVFEQQIDKAWEILRSIQEEEETEYIQEILEEPQKRKKYMELLKSQMDISEARRKKIFAEIKAELIG